MNNKINFSQLINELENPKPYEAWDSLWTDPHIYDFFFKAHIDPDVDVVSRKEIDIDKTVEKINEMIKPGSKILDLGCGVGHYAKKLAAKGHDVTGVDISKGLIDYAMKQRDEHNLAITYINEDILDVNFEAEFDLVITIYCNFGMFAPDKRTKLISIVKKALRPDGIFLFDAMDEAHINKMNLNPNWEVATQGGNYSPNPYVALMRTFHFLAEKAVLDQFVVMTENNDPKIYRHLDHYFDEEDIKCMFKDFSSFRIMDFALSEGYLNFNDVKFYAISLDNKFEHLIP